ncbi:hypothetical protein [Gordonia sp. VNK21]|uniref:hypothetical protein n=1 Tax=Gordonia sp. VNK21 TaxID=3382483 RepID=UPI0038D3EA75
MSHPSDPAAGDDPRPDAASGPGPETTPTAPGPAMSWRFSTPGHHPAAGQYPRPAGAELPPAAPNHRRRNWLIGGGAAALVAVLGLIAVVIWAVPSQGESGSTTAENAALDMLAAVSKRDVRSIAGLLSPAESGSLGDVLRTAQDKAEQVGTPDGGGPSGGLFDGITVTTTGVTTRTESLNDDLSRVTFTSGSITLTVDPAVANQAVREILGEELASGIHTIDVADLRTRTADGGQLDPFVMVVRDDARWYVSPLYTAVEYRVATDADPGVTPDYGADVHTADFADPEAAAAGFVEALSVSTRTGSIEPVAAALPHYYGRLAAIYRSYLDAQLGSGRVDELTFSGGEYSSHRRSGTTYVTVERLNFTARRGGQTTSGTVVDDCLQADGGAPTRCLAGLVTTGLPSAAHDLSAGNGAVATRDGDGWHIDPVQTALRSALTVVQGLSEDDLYRLIGVQWQIPRMIMRIDADASLVSADSVTLAPQPRTDPQLLVVDLELQAGRPVTIGLDGIPPTADADLRVYTADGRVGGENGAAAGDGHSPLTVTPTVSGPAKLVITLHHVTGDITVVRS